MYIHTYIHTYISIYIYTYTYIYIHIYSYMFIRTYVPFAAHLAPAADVRDGVHHPAVEVGDALGVEGGVHAHAVGPAARPCDRL